MHILESMIASDYFAVQAIFMIIMITAVLANFVADLIYWVLDPRINYG